jgi:diguanylate cyclase
VALRYPNEEQAALVARADKAMYQAKKSGKNRVIVAE